MNNINYYGEWWLPSNPELKIPGHLSINHVNGDITLKVQSDKYFEGDSIFNNGLPIRHAKIILGNVNHGEQITLFHFTKDQRGVTLKPRQINKDWFELTCEPNFAFIGKHFTKEDELRFKSYSFEYSYLDSWIDNRFAFFEEINQGNPETYRTVRKSDPLKVDLPENGSLIIEQYFETRGEYSRKFSSEAKYFVSFNFPEAQPLQKFFESSSRFQSLLTLATGFPAEIMSEYTMLPHDEEYIDLYNSFRHTQESPKVNSQLLFFSIYEFGPEGLKKIIEEWYKIYSKYQAAIELFVFAVKPFWRKGSTTLDVIRFTNGYLNICQAIETVFNKDDSIDYLSIRTEFANHKQIVYDKIKKRAGDLSLSEDDIQFLNEAMYKFPKTQGELHLKQKFLFLIKSIETALVGFIDKNQFEDFAGDLVNFRHDLTHINHGNSDDLFETGKLAYLFYRSQVLFYALIMNKLGIDQEKINQIMSSSDKFRMYYNPTDEPNS